MQNSGRLGVGQTANAEDMVKVWGVLQMMLQEWQQKRWLVYHLVTYTVVSTGAQSYTFGPGGQINTNVKAAWGLEALAPLSGFEGTDYFVGEIVTLSAAPASGTPSAAQQAQVTEVDSGAVVSVQTDLAAVGSIQFFANPINGETITLDGVVWTFVSATAAAYQTQIQANADLTVAQLVTDLNASEDESVSLATYSVTGTLALTTLLLRVMYDATGEEGNEFTLAASTAVPSGATLEDGAANSTLYPGPLPNTWNQASTTGVGLGLVLGFAQWASGTAIAVNSWSQRPAKLESAYLRQINSPSPNQVDFPLNILQSHEDYDKIALKSMESFPGAVFLDSQYPLANLLCYPVAQADVYSINLTVRETLQTQYATLATPVNLPFEYYSAIVYNGAIRCRPLFQIQTYPGDPLPGLATNSLATVRGPNTQIARLVMPAGLSGRKPNNYNIFSDRF